MENLEYRVACIVFIIVVVDKVECIFVCVDQLNGNNGEWTNGDDMNIMDEGMFYGGNMEILAVGGGGPMLPPLVPVKHGVLNHGKEGNDARKRVRREAETQKHEHKHGGGKGPAQPKLCKFGFKCTLNGCKFAHPKGEDTVAVEPEEQYDEGYVCITDPAVSWIEPLWFTMTKLVARTIAVGVTALFAPVVIAHSLPFAIPHIMMHYMIDTAVVVGSGVTIKDVVTTLSPIPAVACQTLEKEVKVYMKPENDPTVREVIELGFNKMKFSPCTGNGYTHKTWVRYSCKLLDKLRSNHNGMSSNPKTLHVLMYELKKDVVKYGPDITLATCMVFKNEIENLEYTAKWMGSMPLMPKT